MDRPAGHPRQRGGACQRCAMESMADGFARGVDLADRDHGLDYILRPVPTRDLNRVPLLAFILVLHVCCAALWSLSVPAFETPDETGHARYVNFLIENGRLPREAQEAPGEAHQPPLYYLLAAASARGAGLGSIDMALTRNPAFRWYGGQAENKYLHEATDAPPLSGSARALHWLRLLSVAMSAGTVALVWKMGIRSGRSPGAAAVAAAMAAFIPQFTFIAGSLNNDNLANLLSAAAL